MAAMTRRLSLSDGASPSLAHERVIESGASFTAEHVSPRPGSRGERISWRVCRDPAGQPFCLVVR